MDEHVEGVAFDLFAPAIEPLLELRPRQDGARPLHQGRHQRELPGRKDPMLIAIVEHVCREVEHEAGRLQDRAGEARATPQHGSHAGHDFARVEGFHDVIVCPEVESGDAVFDVVARRDDQDRCRVARGPYRAQNVEAVPVGQVEVEQHDGIPVRRESFLALDAAARPIDHHALVLERLFQSSADRRIVFDQENPHERNR